MSLKRLYAGIKGIVVRDDGRVLLLRTVQGKTFWDVPGGRIDDDEDVLQTLDRELHEELPNLKYYRVDSLLHVERVHRDIEDDTSLLLVFYLIKDTIFDGEPQLGEEHSA